jgi:hypothetical protein
LDVGESQVVYAPAPEEFDAAVDFAWRIGGRVDLRPPPPRSRDRRTGGASLDEVAAELGVTRQRAHQIEREALAKCRVWCEDHGIRLRDVLPM